MNGLWYGSILVKVGVIFVNLGIWKEKQGKLNWNIKLLTVIYSLLLCVVEFKLPFVGVISKLSIAINEYLKLLLWFPWSNGIVNIVCLF